MNNHIQRGMRALVGEHSPERGFHSSFLGEGIVSTKWLVTFDLRQKVRKNPSDCVPGT